MVERHLSPEERQEFSKAKSKEVKNYVVNAVLSSLPAGMKPPREKVLRMRWVLEWKVDEQSGDKKAKARIVILGYLDPECESRPTTSPTMTRTTRQLVLQLGAAKKMTAAKADVKGAFLQGRKFNRELYVIPVPELAKELGMSSQEAAKLERAAYGLVEAPIEWYLSICETLEEFGWRRLHADPCCWILLEPGADESVLLRQDITDLKDSPVVAIAAGHVDDFLFLGIEGNAVWEESRRKLQEKYDWKDLGATPVPPVRREDHTAGRLQLHSGPGGVREGAGRDPCDRREAETKE